MRDDEWAEARAHLADSLLAGWRILVAGGRALDAVQATVLVMEDSPHFNAGHGAALNKAGEHELDASIMDGETAAAGAISVARRIRNPILAARAVLEDGESVQLAGAFADDFARRKGLAMVEPSYFTTERRVKALASLQDHAKTGTLAHASEAEKHGTVGAVARDAKGNLAAATSTGGFNNKPEGRISDSSVIGAGTYAENGVCAVSGTGRGEIFIRRVAAHDVAARIRYAGHSLEHATDAVIARLGSHGIGAGMIALGAEGGPVAPYNTLGMYRGWVTEAGEIVVATHAECHVMGPAR